MQHINDEYFEARNKIFYNAIQEGIFPRHVNLQFGRCTGATYWMTQTVSSLSPTEYLIFFPHIHSMISFTEHTQIRTPTCTCRGVERDLIGNTNLEYVFIEQASETNIADIKLLTEHTYRLPKFKLLVWL